MNWELLSSINLNQKLLQLQLLLRGRNRKKKKRGGWFFLSNFSQEVVIVLCNGLIHRRQTTKLILRCVTVWQAEREDGEEGEEGECNYKSVCVPTKCAKCAGTITSSFTNSDPSASALSTMSSHSHSQSHSQSSPSSPLRHLNEIRRRFPRDRIYKAVTIPGTEKPGHSPVYRNAASPDKLVSHIPGLSTLHELFQNAVDLFGDDDCLGQRLVHDGKLDGFYTYQTYNEINKRRINVASGLIRYVTNHPQFDPQKFIEEGKPKFVVAVSGQNSVEMLLMDLATRSFSLPNTGLYEALSDQNAHYILEVTKAPVLVLSKHLISKFLNIKETLRLSAMFLFISFEPITSADSSLVSRAQGLGVDIVDFQTIEKLGQEHVLPPDFNLPKPQTLYTLAFTSGTTGLPKGVYLTHAVAASNVTGFFVHLPKPAVGLTPEQQNDFSYNRDSKGNQLKTICYLPLLHNYEKSITNFEMSYGIALALPSKPGTQSLFEDIKIIKPSIFTGVPRVFTLVENETKRLIAKAEEKNLLKSTMNDLQRSQIIRKLMGFENVSYLQCASAPISKESIIFLRTSFQCGFLNSYGATELFSVISYANPYEILAGSSGPVAVNSELRLKDVPEMGYSSKDEPYPRGEVLIRGFSQFSHYFQNPKATLEAIDDEGWYHSGDVASLDANGNLFIVDRVKNFFKLSQGEYITPEKIETIYLSKNPILTQLFVHGDSFQNYLIGVAGVNFDHVKKFLMETGIFSHDSNFLRELSQDEILQLINFGKVKRHLLEYITHNIQGCDLQGFEKLHNIHFELTPLSVENETLTPSLKLKRNSAKLVHKEKLDRMYKEGDLIRKNRI